MALNETPKFTFSLNAPINFRPKCSLSLNDPIVFKFFSHLMPLGAKTDINFIYECPPPPVYLKRTETAIRLVYIKSLFNQSNFNYSYKALIICRLITAYVLFASEF